MGHEDKAKGVEELEDEVDLKKADEASASPGRPIGHADYEESETDGKDEGAKEKLKQTGESVKEAFKPKGP